MEQSLRMETFDLIVSYNIFNFMRVIQRKEFDVIIINLGQLDELRFLIDPIRFYQPNSLVVGVSDSLERQQSELFERLQGAFILSPDNIGQLCKRIEAQSRGYVATICLRDTARLDKIDVGQLPYAPLST
jgi:hypothetical protein